MEMTQPPHYRPTIGTPLAAGSSLSINFCISDILVFIHYFQCIPVPIILVHKYGNVNINV